MASTVAIDPKTGEVMGGPPPQIDPVTGEVVTGPPPPPPPEPTGLQKAMTGVKDFGTGVLKGAGSTMSAADDFARQHLPAFMTNTGMGFGKPENIPLVHGMMQPNGTAQAIGKGVEQAGEFLIPGAAESKFAEAPLLARTVLGAAGAGAVNKVQGGSFGAGAAGGAAGNLLGAGIKAAAPAVAETALGIRGLDRAFGRTPGQAILEDTQGLRPAMVEDSARQKIGGLTKAMESSVASAPPVSLQPALDVADQNIAKYQARNSPIAKSVQSMREQLTRNGTTGLPLSPTQPAMGTLNLKRGLGDFVGSWPMEQQKGVKGVARQMYGALDSQVDAAAPGTADLNQRISSLIPVANRAEASDLNAGAIQKALGRIARPTGALAGTITGGYEGYKHGGVTGAIAGGLTGLALPEMLSSPTSQMLAARAMHGAFPKVGGRVLAGSALQLNRSGNKAKDE